MKRTRMLVGLTVGLALSACGGISLVEPAGHDGACRVPAEASVEADAGNMLELPPEAGDRCLGDEVRFACFDVCGPSTEISRIIVEDAGLIPASYFDCDAGESRVLCFDLCDDGRTRAALRAAGLIP